MRTVKAAAWTAGLLVLAAAAVVGINATDEELTELAKRAMAMTAPPAPWAENAYADLAALKEFAPPGDMRGSCVLSAEGCLRSVPANPNPYVFEAWDGFAKAYRAARVRPIYAETETEATPETALPAFQPLFRGQERAFLSAASLANAGRLDGALAELEAENAFHRRMAAGSRHLVSKMMAFALLQRDALFASELARIPGRRAVATLGRVKTLVRPLSPEEGDVRRVLEVNRAEQMGWTRTRRDARVSDTYYEVVNSFSEAKVSRPWWDPLAPYLYRPNQSLNLYAAQTELLFSVASRPSTQYPVAMHEARDQARALAPSRLVSLFVNPVGRDHPYIGLGDLGDNKDPYTLYIGRSHVTQALNSLVALQIELRAAGATREDAIEQALAGPLGAAHPDPFTGGPMRFDRATRTIGFELPPALGPYLARLERSYRRVAVEVAADN